MKEQIIINRVDYAKINGYYLEKNNYKKDEVEMLKVVCAISYSCSYLGRPAGGNTKHFILYNGVEIPDTEWLKDVPAKLEEYRSIIKKDVAGWPE